MKKTTILAIVALLCCAVMLFAGCGNKPSTPVLDSTDTGGAVTPEHPHEWGDWTTVRAATCIEEGTQSRACTVCGETEKQIISKTEHRYENDVCVVCGMKKPSEGLAFTSNDGGNSYVVMGIGTCTDTDIVIPETYQGKPVTSIVGYAFAECSSLKSITIPDSITSIGDDAFSGCSSLQYNSYGNGNYLGNETNPYVVLVKVKKNTSIATCKIHEATKIIGGGAFSNYSRLTSIVIPDGVINIGDAAFLSCSNLTSVTIPDSVTGIGSWAFGYCNSLESITIPDNVTSIGNDAFAYCSSLKYNEYENGYYLGNANNPYVALIRAESMSSSCQIHKSTKVIALLAFSNCCDLTDITVAEDNPKYHSAGNCIIETQSKILIIGCQSSIIPTDGSVTSIGAGAFYNCRNLTSITIPDSVTSIGDEAFNHCSSLISVTIGNSVTSIGGYAFARSSLISVVFANPNGWYVSDDPDAASGTDVTVTDAETAAAYLTGAYYEFYWKRK